MKIGRAATDVSAAASALSDIAPDAQQAMRDVSELARAATVAFLAVGTVAICALFVAVLALSKGTVK